PGLVDIAPGIRLGLLLWERRPEDALCERLFEESEVAECRRERPVAVLLILGVLTPWPRTVTGPDFVRHQGHDVLDVVILRVRDAFEPPEDICRMRELDILQHRADPLIGG